MRGDAPGSRGKVRPRSKTNEAEVRPRAKRGLGLAKALPRRSRWQADTRVRQASRARSESEKMRGQGRV